MRVIIIIMKKPILIGNWKTNPSTLIEAKKNILAIDKKLTNKKQNYFLAVPDIYLSSLKEIKTKAQIGVQNINGIEQGAHTGASTVQMAKSAGATFAILGHSEVRKEGETDEKINEKIKQVLATGMDCVLCVGESIRDKEGKYLKFIEQQLMIALHDVRKDLFTQITIAYEPIWAVGAKEPANPHECFEVAIAIRRTLTGLVSIDHAKKVSILYGGAVDEKNAPEFIKDGGVDGLLIGRASLHPDSFSKIIINCYGK